MGRTGYKATCEAMKLLSRGFGKRRGLWVREIDLGRDVIFDTFSHYGKMCGKAPPTAEGCTVRYGDRYIILYSKSWNIARLNYTLAHEIGHILLSHEGENEAEANAFASALLIPPVVLRYLTNANVKRERDIADFFGVSVTAAAYALSRGYIATPYDRAVLDLFMPAADEFIASKGTWASIDISCDI